MLLLPTLALNVLNCRPDPPPLQDPDQALRRTDQARCDRERLPAQQEFVTAISQVLETPEDSVRLTRLKPWTQPCCNYGQPERAIREAQCSNETCWSALAEAIVPPTEERGKKHVGFYVYTRHCKVYHDYHYRYGWSFGKP